MLQSCAHLVNFLFLQHLWHIQQQMAVVVAITTKIVAPTAVTTTWNTQFSQNGLSPASQNVSLKGLMVMSQLRFTCKVVPEN